MPNSILYPTKIKGIPTQEFTAWRSMKQRCYTPATPMCKRNYRDRGIIVCERWNNSFQNFRQDVGPRPSPDHSLDRWPNNDGNYEPGNVRWATRTEQRRNTRFNRMITFNGKTQPQSAWVEETGLMWDTIYRRLRSGWSIEKTLTTPALIKRRRAAV